MKVKIIPENNFEKSMDDLVYNAYFDLNTIKQLMSFSGWSFFGSTASVSVFQIITILINLFFGQSLTPPSWSISPSIASKLFKKTSSSSLGKLKSNFLNRYIYLALIVFILLLVAIFYLTYL